MFYILKNQYIKLNKNVYKFGIFFMKFKPKRGFQVNST